MQLQAKVRRQMNGQSRHLKVPLASLATVSVPAPMRAVSEPKTWATALERCRVEAGLKQAELLVLAFPDDRLLTVSDIKRLETAHAIPSTSQAQKLRTVLPKLYGYDHLLAPSLQASPKDRPREAPKASELWPGPPVKDFGEALRWCLKEARMGFTDLERGGIGASASAVHGWGNGTGPGTRVIRQNYEALCKLFPALAHAPQPEFSVLRAPVKKKAYHLAEERRILEARARGEHLQAVPETAPAPAPVPVPTGPDRSRLQAASAALGIYMGELASLKVQVMRLKAYHDEELTALGAKQRSEEDALKAKIAETEKLVKEQEGAIDQEANAMHGGRA